jgi:citrate lyase subunit beta/citryl-CoA lyase
MCIHPRRVEAVNRGFMPTEEEISWAGRVLDAVEESGSDAIRVDGEVVDRPVVERARAISALAELGPESPSEANG